MKGTITQIFHNERSSKLTVDGVAYICNAKTRRELSAGDVVEFDKGDFNGKPTANNLRKVGREEVPAQPSPTSSPAAAASTGGTAPARFQRGKDDPETAARIARSVAVAESTRIADLAIKAEALPLPKDEKKRLEALEGFLRRQRDEVYNYVAGVKAGAADAPKGAQEGSGPADLGSE